MQTCITYYCVQELQGSSGKVVIEKEKIENGFNAKEGSTEYSLHYNDYIIYYMFLFTCLWLMFDPYWPQKKPLNFYYHICKQFPFSLHAIHATNMSIHKIHIQITTLNLSILIHWSKMINIICRYNKCILNCLNWVLRVLPCCFNIMPQ